MIKLQRYVGWPALTVIASFAGLYLVAWHAISPPVFFSPDLGVRFIQIQQLVEHQWQTFAISYPARSLDPNLHHVPYYYGYSVVDGQIYFNIGSVFPLLASLLYAGIGTAALPLLPILGSVCIGLVVFQLARFTDLKFSLVAFCATVFATPVLFYSVIIWNHTVGTALGLLATYGLVLGFTEKRHLPLFLGGIATGLSFSQRPELYVFAVSLAIATLLVYRPAWQQLLTVLSGGLAGALPVWILHYVWVGHPFGMLAAPNLFGYGNPEVVPFSPEVFGITRSMHLSRLLIHLDPYRPVTYIAGFCVLAGIAILFLTLRHMEDQKRPFLFLGIGFTAVGYALYVPATETYSFAGFISALPLLPLAVTYVDRDSHESPKNRNTYHFVFATAIAFLALMFVLWPTYGGKQWGARYLLPAYPLFIYLALYAYNEYSHRWNTHLQNVLRFCGISLLVLSVFVQFLSLRLLFNELRDEVALYDQVAQLPVDLVVTSGPYLGARMQGALPEKTFLFVSDTDGLEALVPRFVEHNIDRFAVLVWEDLPVEVPARVGATQIREVSPSVYELYDTTTRR